MGGEQGEAGTSYAAKDNEELVHLIQHHPEEKENIQQAKNRAECKRNVPSCPHALYSGSALDSEHNKHTSLPQYVPGTMLDPGYQVTETWPLGESAQGH